MCTVSILPLSKKALKNRPSKIKYKLVITKTVPENFRSKEKTSYN